MATPSRCWTPRRGRRRSRSLAIQILSIAWRSARTVRGSSVAFSRDGTRIVGASHDGTLKVWDAETGQETLTFTGHSSPCLKRGIQLPWGADRQRKCRRDSQAVGRRDGAGGVYSNRAFRRGQQRGVQSGRKADRQRERRRNT
jgi:hypothetical protein